MSSNDSMGPMRVSLLSVSSWSTTTLSRSLVSATCLGVRASTRSDGAHAASLGAAASVGRFSALPGASLPAIKQWQRCSDPRPRLDGLATAALTIEGQWRRPPSCNKALHCN